MYNLDVGEHYYQPLTNYLDAERGTRGETPGALTFDERLARNWLHGRRYEAGELRERYARASSLARGEQSASYLASDMAARSGRAASEMRASSMQQSQAASRQQMISASMSSSRQESSRQTQQQQSLSQRTVSSLPFFMDWTRPWCDSAVGGESNLKKMGETNRSDVLNFAFFRSK